jgi:MSHA pilin protein MshA
MQKSRGFTLIELVAVIVILGILAAVAVPKYVSLQDDAYNAAAQGYAGAAASWSAMNYGKYLVNSASATPVGSSFTCSTSLGAAAFSSAPANMSFSGTIGSCGSGSVTTACSVKHTSGGTFQTISLICTN